MSQIRDVLQIHEQSITNFLNSTLEQMNKKKIRDLNGEKTLLENEVAELKKSLHFHIEQWE